MKSYGQFCAVARALDVIGDRWSLLVVRELLIADARWTDLRDGLPGVAKNLLAERLRTLEASGVLERDGERYRLTDRGRELAPVVYALAGWGAPLLAGGPGDDAVRANWAAIATGAYPAAELLEIADDHLRVRLGGDIVEGRPEDVLRAIAVAAVAAHKVSTARRP